MKAIVLAAGSGARLKPLTDSLHKSMVSVAGERIIDRILDALLIARVHEVVVVLGYRADELRNHLLEAYRDQVQFTFILNDRFESTNNIYSLSLALDAVDDDFVLIECDVFFEKEVIRQLVEFPWPNATVVAKYKTSMDGTVVSVDASGMVVGVHPTDSQGPTFDFSDKYKTLNIYKLSGSFLRDKFRKMIQFYTQAHSDNCYYEVVLGVIIYLRSADIKILDLTGRTWMEVDDMHDLDKAEFMFKPEGRYDLLANSHGGYWNYDLLDFCYIRNMYFPTPSVISDIRFNLEHLLRNYGSNQAGLNAKLGHFLLAPQQNCCLLNGASQGIKLLPRLLDLRRVVTFVPTFEEYRAVFPEALGIDPENRPLPDLARVAIEHGIKAIVLANPNNPTGRCYSRAEVLDLLETAERAGLTTILDESFIDFAGGAGSSMTSDLLSGRLNHAILIKSLSKSLGAPGLRLGYCLSGDTRLIQAMNAALPIWNTNSLAQYYLELLLKYRNEIAASFKRTMEDREAFFSLLASLTVLQPFPSAANFILCQLTSPRFTADALARRLTERSGIYVKACTSKFPPGRGEFIRVAVRTPADNDQLVRALREAYDAS